MTNHLSALPTEVLHLILHELPMGDILASLCLVSKRLRAVCLTHPHFAFDFNLSAKKKRQFDAVCAQLPVVASQIGSITFSNDFESLRIGPFFSRLVHTNDTFSRLQSISLCYIDYQTWRSINSRLTSFPSLVTLTIECQPRLIDRSLASELLCELLYDSRSLKRLHLKVLSKRLWSFRCRSSSRRKTIVHRTSLRAYGLRIFNLAPLLEVTPALQSLNLDLVWPPFPLEPILHSSSMLRHLSIKSYCVSMHRAQVMLESLVHLTHLTMIIDEVHADLADGVAWAPLLKSISIFKFRFTFTQHTLAPPAADLASFRTPFWLDEKHWYVTYERCVDTGFTLLYSDPYCHDDYPFYFMKDNPIRVSTSPSLHECGTGLQSRLDYARKHLHLSHIVAFDALDYEPKIPGGASVNFVQRLPRLHKLDLSMTLVKQLLVMEWPMVRDLRIRNDAAVPHEPLTLADTVAIARSFKHLERLIISYDAVEDISSLLNSTETMPVLAEIWVRTYENTILRITDTDWLEKNTKLRRFHYSRDPPCWMIFWLY